LKVAIVLGTRPEIIKMAPIIWELEKLGEDFFILHSGQHYDYKMDRVFFEQLKLPEPKYNLRVGSGTHAEETGKTLIGVEKVLMKESPDVVLVEGDTNTVLAGALAAVKLHINVGHVEAGLRSHDKEMPEEINRIIVDHISDYLFAPTEEARENLLKEGIDDEKVYVTGNTIVDAVHQCIKLAEGSNIVDALGLKQNSFFLLTLHRQENVDIKDRLENIFRGLNLVVEELGLPMIYPCHPRTRKRIERFGIKLHDEIILTEPLDYLSFLKLEKEATMIFTDSGGVQEEACILKVPCVTIRSSTERPETVKVGANIVAGRSPEGILKAAKMMMSRTRSWPNPFGDGKAGKRIVYILRRELSLRG